MLSETANVLSVTWKIKFDLSLISKTAVEFTKKIHNEIYVLDPFYSSWIVNINLNGLDYVTQINL